MYYKKGEESILKNHFDENYYKSINYNNYQNRQCKYDLTALELVKNLNITSDDHILDYGCATGMLLQGFREAGIRNLYGFDISDRAIQQINDKNIIVSSLILPIQSPQFTTFLDVLEHMFDEDIKKVFQQLTTEQIIVRIPVKLKGGSDFYLEVSRKDKTHVNCKTAKERIEYIESFGYEFINPLNFQYIYDSKGCFCGHFRKR